MPRFPALLVVIILAAVVSPAFADFTGEVVRVLDGDTIEVMHDGRAERIRLSGIDCPEKGQPFGNRAKQFTSSLTFAKQVTVLQKDRDRYGRTVADVILPDGSLLNKELVRNGLAWWYRRYAPHEATLRELEDQARLMKQGLWADPHAMPPWEWRRVYESRNRNPLANR
jgi:micrococcal nuclease